MGFDLFSLPLMSQLRILLILAAAGVIVLAVLSYTRTTKPLPAARRYLLLGLRLLAVAAALICLFRPNVQWTSTEPLKGKLNVAVDLSGSMEISGDAGSDIYKVDQSEPRRILISRMLLASRDKLKRLEESYDVTWTTFSDQHLARPGGLDELIAALGTKAAGRATDVGTLLANDSTCKRVLILTDGRANIGPDPISVARRFGGHTAVYAVGVGRETPTASMRDIQAERMEAKDTISLGSRVPIEVRYRFLGGLPTESVELRLLVDGQLVDSRKVAEIKDKYTFDYKFDTVGIHRVRVETDAFDWELNRENNHVEKSVRVVKDKITIRYLEGVRWEGKYVAAELGSWDKADFRWGSGLTQRSVRGLLPTDAEGWKQVDVIIVGSVSRADLGDDAIAWIKERVEAGAGLLMIGGRDNFGAGGYAGSDLEKVLPVKIDANGGHVDKPVRLQPTPAGRSNYLVSLEPDPAKNLEAWKLLPAGSGLTRTQGPKEGAEVLLESEAGEPILVAAEYGPGRSIAFLTESTWTWTFNDLPEADYLRTAAYHRTFWRQVILWLAHLEHMKEKGVNLSVKSGNTSCLVGEEMTFSAYVADEKGRPVKGADVVVKVTEADKADQPGVFEQKAAFRQKDETYQVGFKTVREGTYRVTATAATGGRELGKDELEINVNYSNQESLDVTPDFKTLGEIARVTGGLFVPADDFNRALDRLIAEADTLTYTITKTEHKLYWDEYGVPIYLVIFIFLAALAAEWFLRKRSGLV